MNNYPKAHRLSKFQGKNTTTGTVLQKKLFYLLQDDYMYTCRNCSNCLTCQVHLFPETIPIIPVRLRHEVIIMDTVCIYSIYKHINVLHMYTIVLMMKYHEICEGSWISYCGDVHQSIPISSWLPSGNLLHSYGKIHHF